MFWSHKEDKKRPGNPAGRQKDESTENGSDEKAQKKSSLLQKLFHDGCDRDFVYYEE